MNGHLEALATLSSGATAPSVTFANQLWFDTANSILYKRNNADTNWIILGSNDANGLIQSNAGNPNNVVTGNYQGEFCYDTSNNVPYFYTGAGTVWASGVVNDFFDCEYTSASSITIKAGTQVQATTDSINIIYSSNQVVNLTVSGAGGLDTGSEANDTWYYVYAIQGSSGVSALFSTVNEANSGSITLPSGYTKKRQLPIAVRNDGSGDILPFKYLPAEKKVLYIFDLLIGGTPEQLVNTATAIIAYTDVDCSDVIPPISKMGLFSLESWSGGGSGSLYKLREDGTTTEAMIQGGVGSVLMQRQTETPTSAAQVVEYSITTTNFNRARLFVEGYVITEVN